ncbi:MAG: energy transducer TonB, partial [Acidobacteria bacterium]|nr:energy transducer TonB [Acidobacteriota bacterium]
MHDCHVTKENLVDLLADELDAARRRFLLDELELCAACQSQFRSLSETLQVFQQATAATLPAEDFWPGYEERLLQRMAQEIRPDMWQQAAATLPFMHGEYRLTFLEDEGLTRRLTRELKSVAHESQLTWPELKRDPLGFTRRSATAYTRAGWKFFSQRNVALAAFASFLFVSVMLGSLYALDRYRSRVAEQAAIGEELEVVGMIDLNEIPKEQEKPDDGTAGMAKGNGGGSKPKQEKAQGGGGGGRQEQAPASFGKLPAAQLQPQILPPNPRPPTIKNPSLPTAPTIDADPALFPPDTRPIAFGDPKSKSTEVSSGPGKGGGIGDGTGGGVGPGEGGGVGPGRGGNTGGGDRNEGGGGPGGGGGGTPVDYNRTFRQNEVTRKALIVSKPEPGFTEEARKENVTGIVRLRAVLSSSGAVTNISVVKGLPGGLTEKAVAAARNIRFQPAQK